MMSRFEWKETYSVSNDAVDADHQGFFKLASELDSMPMDDARLDDILHQLEDYAAGHFAREEALMAKINFPEFEAHKEKHAAFVAWLADLRTSDGSIQDKGRRVGDFLEKWLAEHILKDDMRYRDYIMTKN